MGKFDHLALEKIKDWYMFEYPNDDIGELIDDDITFQGLFLSMDVYQNVYDTLGISDSLIRERVFYLLAEIMEVDYDYVYQQWLRCR